MILYFHNFSKLFINLQIPTLWYMQLRNTSFSSVNIRPLHNICAYHLLALNLGSSASTPKMLICEPFLQNSTIIGGWYSYRGRSRHRPVLLCARSCSFFLGGGNVQFLWKMAQSGAPALIFTSEVTNEVLWVRMGWALFPLRCWVTGTSPCARRCERTLISPNTISEGNDNSFCYFPWYLYMAVAIISRNYIFHWVLSSYCTDIRVPSCDSFDCSSWFSYGGINCLHCCTSRDVTPSSPFWIFFHLRLLTDEAGRYLNISIHTRSVPYWILQLSWE